jgi:serine protease SohB
VERRLYTSGEHKAMLDPFLPEKSEDVERLKAVQREIHEGFIDLVKHSRGARLTGPEKTLFSGEYWTGGKAIELGIADAIGNLRSTLRTRFGENVLTPLISPDRSLFGRSRPGVGLGEGSGGLGRLLHAGNFAEELISALEARALWARYGL